MKVHFGQHEIAEERSYLREKVTHCEKIVHKLRPETKYCSSAMFKKNLKLILIVSRTWGLRVFLVKNMPAQQSAL